MVPAPGRLALLGGAALAARRLLRRRPLDLDGSVVLVTGGSRGLGLAMARHFADRGARLALLARNATEVAEAAAELRADGHEAVSHVADVTRRSEVEDAVGATVAHYGRLDVVVANAGAALQRREVRRSGLRRGAPRRAGAPRHRRHHRRARAHANGITHQRGDEGRPRCGCCRW